MIEKQEQCTENKTSLFTRLKKDLLNDSIFTKEHKNLCDCHLSSTHRSTFSCSSRSFWATDEGSFRCSTTCCCSSLARARLSRRCPSRKRFVRRFSARSFTKQIRKTDRSIFSLLACNFHENLTSRSRAEASTKWTFHSLANFRPSSAVTTLNEKIEHCSVKCQLMEIPFFSSVDFVSNENHRNPERDKDKRWKDWRRQAGWERKPGQCTRR